MQGAIIIIIILYYIAKSGTFHEGCVNKWVKKKTGITTDMVVKMELSYF